MISQGEVWWADLPELSSSAPGFRRPVVVVQVIDAPAALVHATTALDAGLPVDAHPELGSGEGDLSHGSPYATATASAVAVAPSA